MIKRIFLGVSLSLGLSLLVTAIMRFRGLHDTWGIDPDDTRREMPGDGIVSPATIVETRGIEIDAAPGAVWPWLVQMGYERGGWYSYDRMDVKGSSADRIIPEFQSLAEGDTVPAWPGGGFRVDVVEPGRALVLYLDSAITATAAARGDASSAPDSMPGGLQAAGAMGGRTMPEFRATWSFLLDPVGEQRTRLVERFRVWAPAPKGAQRFAMPAMGYGIFLMTRKHMLGLKTRAEGWTGPLPTPATEGQTEAIPAPDAAAAPAS